MKTGIIRTPSGEVIKETYLFTGELIATDWTDQENKKHHEDYIEKEQSHDKRDQRTN